MIYQVFLGRWESANIHKHSGEVIQRLTSKNWSALFTQGFREVYLLGLFDNRSSIVVDSEERQLLSSTNRQPSPFALIDHRSVHPDLGTLDDMKKLVTTIQKVGLKVLVDFVPNHRSLDHLWSHTHPNYFWTHNGQYLREFSGDVIKLNYESYQLRQEMLNTLLTVSSWGVDGFRCDMAHYVPISFWKEAVAQVRKKYPHIQFYGEVYPEDEFDTQLYTTFLKVGFDGIYHGLLFNTLVDVIHKNKSTESIVSHLNYIVEQNWSHQLINYIANHDDFLPDLGTFGMAATALILGLPGKTLHFNGSLLGKNTRLSHHRLDILDESQLELNHAPIWFQSVKGNYQKYGFPSHYEWNHQNLITGINNQGTHWYYNFMDHEIPLPKSARVISDTQDNKQSVQLKAGEVAFNYV